MNHHTHLSPGHWNLLVSPSQTQLLTAIAYLAHDTELIVFDCGRRFDPSIVARAARGREEITDRIKGQRAHTCFDVVELLRETKLGTPPILVLDFLKTFQDANVSFHTRRFLLQSAISHFQRLSKEASLAVTISKPLDTEESRYLFGLLKSSAPNIQDYVAPQPIFPQLRLFK